MMIVLLSTRSDAENVYYINQNVLWTFDGEVANPVFFDAGEKISGFPQMIFDKQTAAASRTPRLLFTKTRRDRTRPGHDATSGWDAWLYDPKVGEKRLDAGVWRASFSPRGTAVVLLTDRDVMRFEGGAPWRIPRAHDPHWSPDGGKIVFSQGADENAPAFADGLYLTTLDVETGVTARLTSGKFDDVRGEYHPSGKWILFVSGERTGLASFWKIPAEGGEPVQLTNVGLVNVDKRFVPTPYGKTIWSSDGRWFIYDFKNGPVMQTWGLMFSETGDLAGARRLADGLDPQWIEMGRVIAVFHPADAGANLPQKVILP